MAASDEEGGQSDTKNDDSANHETSKQFSTIHQQEIESQLIRPGVSYENRVSAVLSGWEHLAGTVQGDVSQVQPLATFLYRWSLRLVLQGEWPGLAQIVKTRLGVTLHRCSRVAVLQPLCRTLLPLVSDPWGQTTKTIFSDSEVQDNEAIKYISNETWEVVRVRVDTMIESRCEELAFRVLKVCIRCIRLRSEGMEVPLYTDEDHNHYVDLYFALLYKFQRKSFLDEVTAQLDVNEGVNLVRRLVAKQDKAKVWKHRLKIADLAIQIFLAKTIVKKCTHDFWSVFHEWCGVQEAAAVPDDLLSQMIHKYMQLSESSLHIYKMSSILYMKFGKRVASLVTELLIRALTMDMNSLEALKLKEREGNIKDAHLQLEQQMAAGFMDLATVFTTHKSVARECVLTAFSLHPTSDRLVLLNSFVREPSPFHASDAASSVQPLPSPSSTTPQSPPTSPRPPPLPPPHSPDFKQDDRTLLGLSAMCLQSSSSTSTTADSLDTLHSYHGVQPTQPPSCFQSTSLDLHRTQISQEHAHSPHLFTRIKSSASDSVQISHNCVGVQDSVNISEMEVTSASAVQVSNQDENDSDFIVKGQSSPPLIKLKDPPHDGQCVTQITVDTGQTPSNFLPTQNSQMSQVNSVSSAQLKTDDVCVLETKDAVIDDEGSENSVNLENRIKDDVDSMDKFYKSTENFIEQLSQETPKKTSRNLLLTNLTETLLSRCQNYDVLTHPNQVLDADQLGLTKELCDDLAVVLSSPRWQVLSWMRDWSELSKICERYLNDADSAKNMTKELKYLNIDYSQFRNMPSAEITEFTGIEKGYEHFIVRESESDYSEGEYCAQSRTGRYSSVDSDSTDNEKHIKRGRGRPKKIPHANRLYDSDSDYDSNDGRRDGSHYVMSESDESDMESKGKTRLLKMEADGGKIVEGKRVTAVSNQDRSKRIRIDAETGKLRRDRNLLNTLRLFRHQKYGGETVIEHKFEGAVRSSDHFAPPLSSLNLNPRVVLTERDKTAIGQQMQRSVTTVAAGRSMGPVRTTPSSQPRGSWRYAGSLVAPNPTTTTRPAASVSLPRSMSVQCYLRAKDGKVRVAPLQRALLCGTRPPNPGGSSNYLRMINEPTSGYDDSYAKFLLQQNSGFRSKGSSVTLTRKNMSLDASLDYLKKQGTTVTYKSQKVPSALALANAQKTVLNRIMSPENAISAMSGRTAIAMPVSNNPPNLPPTDKTNPTNLNRVLPKGTTLVRKPKADGAGPSGLNNGGSSGIVSTRTVLTRPGTFSTVVARPAVTVSSASLRTGNPVMAVRTNAATIRSTYSRGVVVTGNMGVQESVVNSGPTLTSVVASSTSTTGTALVGPASTSTSLPAPLVSATVVGSVLNSNTNNLSSPLGTLGGNNGKQQQQLQQTWDAVQSETVCVSEAPLANLVSGIDSTVTIAQISSTRGATTCTTTVASPPGDIRAASMLETLLRDRPVPPSPLHTQSSTAITTITAALPHTLTSVVGSSGVPIAVSGEGQVTSAVMGTLASTGTSNGSVVITSGTSTNSGVIMASGVVGGATGSGVVVASGGILSSGVGGNGSVGDNSSGAVQQVLVPAQFVQVHTSDGSTGLGIVHSSSLDLRLHAGTRVIKSCSGAVRTAGQQQQVTGVINQAGGRQVNVLHNVKILQNVQNRQIVRTVVVPHTVALQGLNTHQTGHLKSQVVALSQGTSTSSTTGSVEGGVLQPQGPSATVRAKIPPSTIVQKVLGRGGLVIRTLRPQTSTQAPGETSTFEEGLGAKLQQQQVVEADKNSGTSTTSVTVARLPQDEGLGERLSHYLKTALVSSTSTQSVGTQTLTTAVKPSAGQLVNQVAMNHLRSGSATLSLAGAVQGIAGQPNTISTSPTPPQQSNLSSLPLTPTNVVSSETLEQLREFESVFEKVSNKSGKEVADGEASAESYSSATMSSEESMIAAQLLSMANDTPAVTTSSNYVYSVPTTVYDAGGTRLTEGTYITIPSTTQAGTLILVNHSGSGTGIVTVASGVQGQQPPTAPSPTLSSTSSHSSIASSPSSTSSKNKKQPPKSKVVPPTTPPVVAKPKTPPPPKAPAPKPTVAKPQVEESDETKARIQAILEQYKQDLANTPQPQPAPRNRKNCPPPKNEGKSSNKKKSPVKKVEGGAVNSPAVSEGSIVGCPSPSPSPGPASDNSLGLSGTPSGVQTVQYSAQVVSGQVNSPAGNTVIPDDKIKIESGQEIVTAAAPQLLQGVVVSNVKMEGSNLSNSTTSLTQGLAGGRVVQLIHHGGKVTAITTRQPLSKVKTSGQSGPPPNVTIQGRINMNDLMESHIASLLTGGSNLSQTPTVVSKIVQQQQMAGHQAVQQVVVQTSGGQQVLQQVAVQQLSTTQAKSQHQQQKQHQQKCGVIQQLQITGNEEVIGITSPTRSIHVSLPSLPSVTHSDTHTIVNTITSSTTVTKTSIATNSPPVTTTSIITNTPVITNTSTSVTHNSTPTSSATSGPTPLSLIPTSPLTPQANTVTSPPTPQPVIASPHTPSPATELPPTPSSFQMGEESNSSEQSVNEGLAGPLPPFFTLKPFIMQSSQQTSQQNHQSQQQKQQEQQRISDKSFSSGSSMQQSTSTASTTQIALTGSGSVTQSKHPQRGNQAHIQLQISQISRKPASVIRTGVSSGRRLVVGATDGNGRTLGRGTAASPLLVSGSTEVGIAVSPMSGSSSLENSPAATHTRICLATRPQDTRSNSIDSLKSDLSIEEVQIPPSPATLTKQLQSAYMTEAALSPSVSQSQHSGSSYSSPGTTHDLPFTEGPPTSDDSFPTTLTQPGYSSAPSAPGLSVTGVSPEGDAQLGALASPSGDVYLHQSGTGLGLESLETGTLPLVTGMEVRTHSPALSDLVSSGPLLTWSPRSADSMMAQSPSLNDALTANIPLDVNHSEDSLCDSSTGFPGLFSIEGDGVSVSSSTSEDMRIATPGGASSNQQQHMHHQEQESQEQEVTIDLHPRESEQDHTITSTRSPTQLELPVGTLSGMSSHGTQPSGSIIVNQAAQDTPWRFDNTVGTQNKPVANQTRVLVNEHTKDVKPAVKMEEAAGPSDINQVRSKNITKASHSKIRDRGKHMPIKEQELDDVKIVAEVVSYKSTGRERRSIMQNKPDGMTDAISSNSSHEGYNKKRSPRVACTPDRKKNNLPGENEGSEEIPTKNGHDEDSDLPDVKAEHSASNVRSKRRSSQRTVAASPSGIIQSSPCRSRSKPLKTIAGVKEKEESRVISSEFKEDKLFMKVDNKDLKESCEEGVGRTTRGAKRRSEGDSVGEVKRGRGTRLGRSRSDGYVLSVDEDVLNHLDEDCALSRGLRGRHVSGTSDTSSNYSLEHAITPGPHDSPSMSGSRRRRRLSRESSASSRDGSPPIMHDFSPSGVNTRRSSSRDHAKKKKCSCCGGGEQKKSGSGSGRRSSARASRGSSTGTVQ
ncbi:LOW QUALITY PROTEIN: serine-rich adhesin for platelets [Procambarus clarkii]|uniref:LOW QUALITY PROTEIN: serine-rich adhesin for platelets n=1 Tax=Procambarus clarkii TaxID=6728 RepID=UPI00374268BD